MCDKGTSFSGKIEAHRARGKRPHRSSQHELSRSIMSLPAPATIANADAAPADDTFRAVVEELRRVAVPLAESTKTALACIAAAETCWVAAHAACLCSQN